MLTLLKGERYELGMRLCVIILFFQGFPPSVKMRKAWIIEWSSKLFHVNTFTILKTLGQWLTNLLASAKYSN